MSQFNSDKNKNKNKNSNKKKFRKQKRVFKLTSTQQFLSDCRSMFYQNLTYDSLVSQAKKGDKVAGEVVAMKIRSGFLFKKDTDYLSKVVVSSKNPELSSARLAYSFIN